MRYGLPDSIVKAIASSAFNKEGKLLDTISYHFHNIHSEGMMDSLKQAANTNAHKGVFNSKEDETRYKEYLAKTAAINRGAIEPAAEIQPNSPKGKRRK